MGDPVDGDALGAGGTVVGDPTGVGEVPDGVADGLSVCDGLGDLVGLAEVPVGVGLDAVGEGFPAGWVVPSEVAAGTGRTSM